MGGLVRIVWLKSDIDLYVDLSSAGTRPPFYIWNADYREWYFFMFLVASGFWREIMATELKHRDYPSLQYSTMASKTRNENQQQKKGAIHKAATVSPPGVRDTFVDRSTQDGKMGIGVSSRISTERNSMLNSWHLDLFTSSWDQTENQRIYRLNFYS